MQGSSFPAHLLQINAHLKIFRIDSAFKQGERKADACYLVLSLEKAEKSAAKGNFLQFFMLMQRCHLAYNEAYASINGAYIWNWILAHILQ
jgi:hypothetical protein